MAFTVKHFGIEVQCETAEDAAQMVEKIMASRQMQPEKDLSSGGKERAQLVRLMTELSDQQRKILEVIAAEGPKTDRELRQVLGLGGDKILANKKLAGLLMAISKGGIRVGLGKPIHTDYSRTGKGERIYIYSLSQSLAALILEVLKQR